MRDPVIGILDQQYLGGHWGDLVVVHQRSLYVVVRCDGVDL